MLRLLTHLEKRIKRLKMEERKLEKIERKEAKEKHFRAGLEGRNFRKERRTTA